MIQHHYVALQDHDMNFHHENINSHIIRASAIMSTSPLVIIMILQLFLNNALGV